MQERKNHGMAAAPQTENAGNWSGTGRRAEPEAPALNRILKGFGFPASKADIANRLAMEAFTRAGGRAEDLHDLVVQLDREDFPDLESLRKSIRERHAWERNRAQVT